MALRPLSLFVQHDGRSSRRSITCTYRCGNACGHDVPNTSDGEYFRDVAARALSRRQILRSGATTAVVIGGGSLLVACSDDGGVASTGSTTASETAPAGTDFTVVQPNTEDALVVPAGYEQQVVIRWGDPIIAGAPQFDPLNQTAAAQQQQFGYNCDFAGFLPIDGEPDLLLMVTNHEYTTEPMMYPNYDPANPTEEQVRTSMAAHGLSVVEVRTSAGSGALEPVLGQRNRRITATTPMTLTGPAVGSAFVSTGADPAGTTVLGTLNNCSGGLTPWGTVLTAEENFNQYFGNAESVTDPVAAERLARYGIEGAASERLWERFEPRFDLAVEPNEANRFGYIVEFDPNDPAAVPVKHTAMGRFKHEAANIHVTDDGTVVAYSGDDERFDYIYKFVSTKKVQSGGDAAALAENIAILDEGTLYVARLTGNSPASEIDGSGTLPQDGAFDGSGTWIPLLRSGPGSAAESFVDGMNPQEIAVFTRLAADRVGATKMDRPEDTEVNPASGYLYVALTNNSNRGVDGNAGPDEANPRIENKNGHVLELVDDHAGTSFDWNLLLVCGDPEAADTYFGGFDKSAVSPISCPDNVAFDGHGNLWVSTDGNALGSNDGLFSVVVDGDRRGETKQFLTVPVGAETCGPVIVDNRVVVCVQHPGEDDDATFENTFSNWPDGGNSLPRPAVAAVWNPAGNIGV
ncbi:PhoX family protein [Millisia brevis]|uniref:PhoX family protein n=1 Tax=Millisia brevis TaxID=264148 RepID=UPI0008319CE6|nr:PhoX family phosphatase [Millisia brevis]